MKKKEVIINIEVTNEKELFRQLVKVKYLLEEHFEDERKRNIQNSFCNFDICVRKVQIIIKDKKSMFDDIAFTIYDVKEIPEKDLKIIRKYADDLRKKGVAISPRLKKKAEQTTPPLFFISSV